MPDMYLDVDVALSEVPVNILPLIDATDFKTIEDAVAYNAAGMALRWHFVTSGGAYTVTSVTPTSGGDYDWTDQGDSGIYTIEIPASGGASINNDTEGYGWFTGQATGVLPWRGPVIGFRAAGLNNLLLDNAYSATRGLAGTALPDAAADAAGGLPISDAGGLDLDARLDAAVSSRSTLTQTQVTGGAYALNSASFSFDTAFDFTTTQKTSIGTAVAASAVASVTGNVGGNVTGSVGSVVGAVGSVTGAVGSVTGNVGGNVTGSVGSISGVTFPSNFSALAITAGGVVKADLDTIKTQAVVCASGVTFAAYVGNATAHIAVDGSGHVTAGTVADKTGYSISGTTTTLDALQTALSTAHGAGSWATATGFSTHSAADVWAVGTRVLTAGTNIVLAKGTGVTGFNDIAATDIVSSGAITTSGGAVSSVTTVGSVTTKTGYKLASDGLDLIVPADPSAIPVLGAASVVTWIGWFGAESVNEWNITASNAKLRNSADNADLATWTHSDDGTTLVSGEPS